MAQTKRRRKHRGTQAGTIEARGRTGRRPPTQTEAKKVARDRRAARYETPPTWRGALNRAVVMSAVFAVAVVVVFGRPVADGLVLGVLMVALYLPMSYYTDRFVYNRHQRRKQAGR